MGVQERLSIRNIYLYLVCLISLVIAIFAAVNLVRSAVELAYPDPGYYGYVEKDSSLTAEELADQQQAAEDSQRRQAVLGIVGSATTLAIVAPLYVYHWRRIQAELPASPRVVAAAPPQQVPPQPPS